MQALSAMAELMTNSNPRLEVQVIAGSRGENVLVNNNNAMVTQMKKVSFEISFQANRTILLLCYS